MNAPGPPKPWYDSLRKVLLHPLILLLLLCLVSYTGSLWNKFSIDDYAVIFNETGVSNFSFRGLLTENILGVYRPVGHFPLWLTYQLFKTNPLPYHVVNLILFYSICCLFYKIAYLLSDDHRLALLAAALFAVHPANSTLVNYVTFSLFSTALLSMCLSFLCVMYYLKSRKKILYAGSLILLLMGLFSHESCLIYPAGVFCLVYFLKDMGLKRSVVFTLPFFAVVALYSWFRMHFFSLSGSVSVVFKMWSIFDVYLSTVLALIYWYIEKMLVPHNVLFIWTVVVEQHYNSFELYRLIGILAVVVYVIFIRWRKGLKPFALSLFLAGLALEFLAGFKHFPFAEPIIEPGWFYFSSFGFFLLLASGLLWLSAKMKHRLGTLLIIAVLGMYSIFLQQHNRHWRDQESYARYWISRNPGNATPFYNMGQVMLVKGNPGLAVRYFHEALAGCYGYQSAFMTADLGYAYFLLGDDTNALKFFSSALENEPEYSVTYYYLALLSAKNNDRISAESFLKTARERYPQRKFYQQQLARIQNGQSLLSGIYPLMHIDDFQ